MVPSVGFEPTTVRVEAPRWAGFPHAQLPRSGRPWPWRSARARLHAAGRCILTHSSEGFPVRTGRGYLWPDSRQPPTIGAYCEPAPTTRAAPPLAPTPEITHPSNTTPITPPTNTLRSAHGSVPSAPLRRKMNVHALHGPGSTAKKRGVVTPLPHGSFWRGLTNVLAFSGSSASLRRIAQLDPNDIGELRDDWEAVGGDLWSAHDQLLRDRPELAIRIAHESAGTYQGKGLRHSAGAVVKRRRVKRK